MNIQFTKYAIHPINSEQSSVKHVNIPGGAEIESYLTDLLASDASKTESRAYKWSSGKQEVKTLILDAIRDLSAFAPRSQRVAERLHSIERNARAKYHRITELQRGSLFQIFYKRNDVLNFLVAKVFTTNFLDEADYKAHAGLPFQKRVLKTCTVQFDDGLNIESVMVSDSNSEIADYWWREFLELEELSSNEQNTKTAFASIETFLSRRLQSQSKSDYHYLRNNLIGYFKTSHSYSHQNMVAYVFGEYRPVNSSIDMNAIKADAMLLPQKKGFQARFTITPDIIKRRFRDTIPLTPNISLEIIGQRGPDEIMAHKMSDGTKGVFIQSTLGYDSFQTGHSNNS